MIYVFGLFAVFVFWAAAALVILGAASLMDFMDKYRETFAYTFTAVCLGVVSVCLFILGMNVYKGLQ